MTRSNETIIFFSFLFAIVIIGIASAVIINRIRKNKKSKVFDGEDEKQDELPKNK